MKALLHLTLFAALLPAWLLPATATATAAAPQAQTQPQSQAHTYEALDFDVPFKFDIGKHTFRPGHYQLLFVGTGLTVMRDANKHAVASIITRSIEIGYPATESKIVFETKKNRSRMSRICVQFRLQQIEVLGEDLAMEQPALPVWQQPLSPMDVNALMDRRFKGYTH